MGVQTLIPRSVDITRKLSPDDPIIDWYPYQKKWLNDKSRFKIGMMTRQGGKSFCASGEIVGDCIQHEIKGTKTHWVILSRGERQAKEFMDKNCVPMLKAYYTIFKAILKNAVPPKFKEVEYSFERVGDDGTITQAKYKALEITLPGGSRITALPANPDTARGFSANVLLDEFAFHMDSRKIWGALFPCITRGYKIRVISTPNGKNNKFYELMTAVDNTWSKHTVTIHDAIAQGLEVDAVELKAGLGDNEAWAQEFELVFADGAGAALLWDDIVNCERDGAGDPRSFTGGKVFIGNDIAGKGNDLWVAIPFEDINGVLTLLEIIDRRKASFREQDRLLDACVERYRARKIGMDETSIGAKPVEDAIRRYGASRVVGVVFTQASKHAMVQLLQKRFQDRTIAIPIGDKKLRADLHSVKKKVSANGLPSYHAPTGGESHADRFWAIALAIFVAEGGVVEYAYHSASRDAGRDRDGHRQPKTTSGVRAMRGTF